VARRIRSQEALEVSAELMVEHGVPKHIRSDNGTGGGYAERDEWSNGNRPDGRLN